MTRYAVLFQPPGFRHRVTTSPAEQSISGVACCTRTMVTSQHMDMYSYVLKMDVINNNKSTAAVTKYFQVRSMISYEYLVLKRVLPRHGSCWCRGARDTWTQQRAAWLTHTHTKIIQALQGGRGRWYLYVRTAVLERFSSFESTSYNKYYFKYT